MRISDWSSDVCSSDLPGRLAPEILGGEIPVEQLIDHRVHIVGADILAVDVVSMFPHVDHEQRLDARDQLGAGIMRIGDRQRTVARRSEEHTSELQSLMRTSSAVFCLKNKNNTTTQQSQQ